jgi:hypothetical protein
LIGAAKRLDHVALEVERDEARQEDEVGRELEQEVVREVERDDRRQRQARQGDEREVWESEV